jgi:hypothetical protein
VRRGSAATKAAARRADSTFDKIVDALAGVDGAPPDYDRPLDRSFATVAPTMRPDLDEASDPAQRWDEALDWIAEPAAPARATKPAQPPSDDPAAIAAELGLSDALSPAALNRARRRFMWENHPDRRPDLSRELANRRVAIANMLIDRALARPRGPSNGGVSRRS